VKRRLSHCPSCEKQLKIERYACPNCGIKIAGSFTPSVFDLLSEEQQQFVLVFLETRGNFKEVERILNLSYPTIRTRLDSVLQSLTANNRQTNKIEILSAVDSGNMSVSEAIELLKE
jgi:hypothetical protein